MEDDAREQFTREVCAWLDEHLLDGRVEVAGPLELVIGTLDGRSRSFSLEQAWHEVASSPERRPEVLRHLLLVHAEALRPIEVQPDRILPLVRNHSWLQQIRESDPEGPAVPFRHLVGDLWVVLGLDLDHNIATLNEEQLEAAGLTSGTAFDCALANLEERLHPERGWHGPVWTLQAGGDYEPSLLLCHELWQTLTREVEGRLVAAVPSVGMLCYTGTREPGGVHMLQHVVAQTYAQAHHPLSPEVLGWAGDRWEELDLPPPPPLERLRVRWWPPMLFLVHAAAVGAMGAALGASIPDAHPVATLMLLGLPLTVLWRAYAMSEAHETTALQTLVGVQAAALFAHGALLTAVAVAHLTGLTTRPSPFTRALLIVGGLTALLEVRRLARDRRRFQAG